MIYYFREQFHGFFRYYGDIEEIKGFLEGNISGRKLLILSTSPPRRYNETNVIL